MIKMPTGCEFVEIDKLVPYAKNPKNHGDRDVGLIIKSIERNGWGDPLLVCPETMEVLSGNGRLFAGEKLGLEKLPVVYAPAGLSEKQKADLVIASNKLVEISGYNDNLDVLIAEFNLSIDDFGITIPDMDAEMPKLKDGEKEPFQQMTFTFADFQAEKVKTALSFAKKSPNYGEYDNAGNENGNGNALFLIITEWLNGDKC